MRKLAVVLFAVASLCLMAFPAYAAKGDMAFGVNGGIAMPMADLADEDLANMGLGYDFGASFDYFIMPEVAIGLDGSYGAMSNEEDSDLKGKTIQYGAHVKYFVPTGGQLMPYLNLGLAGYNRKVEWGEFDASDNVLGMNAGVGIEYKVTPTVGIGANGAYHYTFGEWAPEDAEGGLDNWNYISFKGAVTFYFPMAK